jgi:hypothetical protein
MLASYLEFRQKARPDPKHALQDTAERGGCHVEFGRKHTATDAIGLEVDTGDELARVRRVVHGH